MRIECLTTFLHGRDRYVQGDVRTVEDSLGGFFIGNGWARSAGSTDVPAISNAEVTLDVHTTAHAQEVNYG